MQLLTDRVRVAGKTTIEDLIVLHSHDIEAQMTRALSRARNEADIRHEFAALLRNFITEAQLAVTARHARSEENAPIPEHHVMFITTRSEEEAHFLCAILNSTPTSLTVAGYTTNTGMSTHVASIIALPWFSAANAHHWRAAELSQQAHAATAEGDRDRIQRLERLIDREVARIFSVSPIRN